MGIKPEGSMGALIPESGRMRSHFRDHLRIRGFPMAINRDPGAAEQLIRSLEGEF